jgi:hypothetical protein
MATPLYKRMKSKGTSFYCFPSAASDLNLANYNDYYNLNFTKFILLNIPRQVNGDPDPIDGIMDFIPKGNVEGETPFYSDDPNYTTPTKLSDQLVESLRNYVANYDTACHESRINANTDFYNIAERYTPTEMIFFKWLRKLNLIDFEPAVHKVDWDKNLKDFDNPNESTITNIDYFRKYLWKEREIIDYKIVSIEESSDYTGSSGTYNTPKIIINEIAKYKVGDKIIFKTDNTADKLVLSGTSGTSIILGDSYIIGEINFTGSTTEIWLDYNYNGGGEGTLNSTYVYLDYNRLIQYIGEINQVTNIQTASRIGQEVTAYIPHQAGKTPTVLFGIRDNTNYYPNLEIPILSSEIQTEIIGAESLNSPIRTNPQDYPGSFFGQFDTLDNTYLCSNGDRLRYQGDYYGIRLTNNTGLNAENYIEKLTDFNSDNIDGIYVDMDVDHYYKMNIPNLISHNFDEFNSVSIEGQAPEDFNFNAILWYYELTERDSENNLNSYVNLYGIEFLNNPDNDDDSYATLISPYEKLVTNGEHDGLSYMFNLNLHYNIDNDVQPLTYDPSTIYNMFGFDLYNEMMRNFYKVNENFVNIIQEFVRINLDIQEMKSLIYSQTSMDDLKTRMNNMEELLRLYSTNQFVNSDTARITVDYSGIYPKLKFDVIGVEYDQMTNVSMLDAYDYNFTNTGASYPVSLAFSNKMLLNFINDNHTNESGDVIVVLDRDLRNKQKLDIIIKPDYALYSQRLYLNMLFNYNNVISEVNIFNVNLPKDLKNYNVAIPENSTFDDSFYLNENIYVNCTDVYTGTTCCATGYTEIVLTEDMFRTGNTVYVQNLYFNVGGAIIDYSGAYTIVKKVGITITIDLPVYNSEEPELSLCGAYLVGQPRVSYYRGLQVSILRINGENTSSFSDRYDVTYKII